MQPLNLQLALLVPLMLSACGTPIKNARTVDVMINGNCGMCEETIEAAGLQDRLAEVDWDRTTRHATITFDSILTSEHAVLERIANAGYDNQEFLATDEAYAGRPQCCQYRRTGTIIAPPIKGEAGHDH